MMDPVFAETAALRVDDVAAPLVGRRAHAPLHALHDVDVFALQGLVEEFDTLDLRRLGLVLEEVEIVGLETRFRPCRDDVEDDDVAEVTAGRALINGYKQNLQAYCEGLREYCTRRGISYLFTSTEVPFDQIVLSYFRKRGLLS